MVRRKDTRSHYSGYFYISHYRLILETARSRRDDDMMVKFLYFMSVTGRFSKKSFGLRDVTGTVNVDDF